MAGPKSSSSSADQTKQQGKKQQNKQQQDTKQQQSESSYKAKLMAASSTDDLSAPDQTQEVPKLPPSKDEGSPPMVPETDAGGWEMPGGVPDLKPWRGRGGGVYGA